MWSTILDTLNGGGRDLANALEPWAKIIAIVFGTLLVTVIPALTARKETRKPGPSTLPATDPEGSTKPILGPHMSLYVDAAMADGVRLALSGLCDNVGKLVDGMEEHRNEVRRLKDEIESHSRQTEGCIDACDALRREMGRSRTNEKTPARSRG